MSDPLISATALCKRFKIYEKPTGRLTEWATLGSAVRHRDFWALRDFSFDVKRGECIGIIGANGAGKSTLLRILSGTLAATSGSFKINGRLLSLLELGTGFNPNLSGRVNVLHTAELLGYSPAYAADRLTVIETFADLGEFFDLPLRMYSSGMQVRLGFSMFAALEPDILVVDEALAVGDASFQRKCFRHMEKMVEDQTRAVVLVAHDMVSIQRLCSRVIWLDHGKIRLQGEPKPVVEAYMKFMFTGQGPEQPETVSAPSDNLPLPKGEGTRKRMQIPASGLLVRSPAALLYPGESVELIAVWMEDHENKVAASAWVDRPLSICYAVRFKQAVSNAVFGIRVSTIRGELLVATNTLMMNQPVGEYAAGQTEIVRWPLAPGLAVGEYFVSCGVSTVEHPYQFLTREVDAYRFAVDGPTRSGALCSLVQSPELGGDAR